MKTSFQLFLFLMPMVLMAQNTPTTKDQLVPFFNEAISSANITSSKSPQTPPLSPPEHEAALKGAQALIMKTGDLDLLKLFLQYQLAYPNPENDRPARMIGEIFFEQSKAFGETLETLGANQRIMIFPYLKFGWLKTIEGRNTSIPSIAEKQKRFDKIARSLINLRGYQDQPSLEPSAVQPPPS